MHDKETIDILEQSRSVIKEITVDEAHDLLEAGEKVTLLDIREPEHVALGYIKGCVFIRGDALEMRRSPAS
jgi:rhodanese-related sulfurtransferase